MFKRGVSNVEMILAFLLFMGFVFVAVFFFLPKDAGRIVDSSLNYAMDDISKNTSVEMISYSVKLYSEKIGSKETVAIEFPSNVIDLPANYNVYAENYSGTRLVAERVGPIMYVNWEGNTFITLRFSEDITPSQDQQGRPELVGAYYSIASSSTRRVLSEKRVIELNESYYNNYQITKDTLGLPGNIDFGFSLKYDNGYSIIAQKSVPTSLEVFSTSTHRETTLVTSNQLLYGDLSVQVW